MEKNKIPRAEIIRMKFNAEIKNGKTGEEAADIALKSVENHKSDYSAQFYAEEDYENDVFAIRNVEGFFETGKEDDKGTFQRFDAARVDKVVNIAQKQNEFRGYRVPVFLDLTDHGEGRELGGYIENIKAETRPQLHLSGDNVTMEPKRTIVFDVIPRNKEAYEKIQSGDYPSISPEFSNPQEEIELDSVVFGQFAPHNRNTPIKDIPTRKVTREREGKTEEVTIFRGKPILCFQGGPMKRIPEKEGENIQKPGEGANEGANPPPPPPDGTIPPVPPPPPPPDGTIPPVPPPPVEPITKPSIPAPDSKPVEQRMSEFEGKLQIMEDFLANLMQNSGDAVLQKMIAASSDKKMQFGAKPKITGKSDTVIELSAKAMKNSDIPDFCEEDARLAYKAAQRGDEEMFLKFSTALTKKVEDLPPPTRTGLNSKTPPSDFEFQGKKISFNSLKINFQSKLSEEEASETAGNALQFLNDLPEKQKNSTFKGINNQDAFLKAGISKIERDLK